MIGSSVGHRRLDRASQRFEIIWEVGYDQARAHGRHATSDIDADRSRDDRSFGRDDRTYSRADTHMHIGHRSNLSEDER
jgi:hypothetical protein